MKHKQALSEKYPAVQSALVSVQQTDQAPSSSFLASMYWQISETGARSHSASIDKPMRSSGSRRLVATLGPPTPAP